MGSERMSRPSGRGASAALLAWARALRDRRSVATRRIHDGVRRAARTVATGGVVLDVGAGRAPWRALFPRAARYLAFDIGALPELDLVASVTDIPVRSNSVDVVCCTEVLEHVADTRAAMAEMRRALKPGGYLIVTTPLLWGEHDAVDYYRWTADGLRRLLTEHGFAPVRVGRRGGIFSVLAATLDQIPFQLLSGSPRRLLDMAPRDRLMFLLAAAAQTAMTPLVWLIAALDAFDRDRRFTLGYIVLARKV